MTLFTTSVAVGSGLSQLALGRFWKEMDLVIGLVDELVVNLATHMFSLYTSVHKHSYTSDPPIHLTS